jgi:hypothetical protein
MPVLQQSKMMPDSAFLQQTKMMPCSAFLQQTKIPYSAFYGRHK